MGGESVIAQQRGQALEVVQRTDGDTAAWLAFSGAIIVALIASATAQWRLREQLSHDRELRDLDELRLLLDECAVSVALANQALIRLMTRAYLAQTWPRESRLRSWWGRRRGKRAGEIEMTGGGSLRDSYSAFWPLNEPIFGLYQRLVLRVGEPDPLARALLAIQERLSTGPMAVEGVVRETELGSEERTEQLDAILDEARNAHFAFLKESQRRAGVKLD